MHENATKALSTGGTIPLGYVSVDKRLQIDPATAPAVRLAFERYAEGMSLARIADELNAQGYRTRAGRLQAAYASRDSVTAMACGVFGGVAAIGITLAWSRLFPELRLAKTFDPPAH